MSFIRKVYTLVLKDKSTFSYGIFRVINLVVAPISAIFIIKYLNINEQGYLYTMNSIVAIATYAELGLAQVITRLVSDSFHKPLFNEIERKLELFNYLKFTIISGLIILILVFITSIIIFIFFFKNIIPSNPILLNIFFVMAITSSFTILVSLLNGFLDACDRNITTNYRRIIDSILRISLLYVLLLQGSKLYAFALSNLLVTFISLVILILQNFNFFKGVFDINELHEFNTKETFKEIVRKILPLQLKYAQTWVTGIFVNAMLIPLVFYYKGESIAGRLGFSLALVGIVYNLSAIIINSQLPYFATLNSQKKIGLLKQVYSSRNILSIQLFTLMSFFLLFFLMLDHYYFSYIENRISEIWLMLLLVLANLLKLTVENKAMFVRSFRVEPFVRVAWTQAIVSLLLMPLATYYIGEIGTILALLIGYIITYFTINNIFMKYQSFN